MSNAAQGELFASILDAYTSAPDGIVSNGELYDHVASQCGLAPSSLSDSQPIGKSGQRHNLTKRSVRWIQQTLKSMGVIERDPQQRGVWQLAHPVKKGLHEALPTTRLVAFSTSLGVAIWSHCEKVLDGLDQQINLAITSPPYLLAKQRAYGNITDESDYVDFVCNSMAPIVKHLAPGGSICLNLGNDIFIPKSPARSLYRERLVLALHDRLGLQKMDELVWHNSSRPPGPIQWASKKRCQLNVAWEPIYWFTNDPMRVKSDNRRVLEPHTEKHLAFMRSGGSKKAATYGDGAYVHKVGSFSKPTEGRIPRNVISVGNSCSDTRQTRRDATALGLPCHGAVFPLAIPTS